MVQMRRATHWKVEIHRNPKKVEYQKVILPYFCILMYERLKRYGSDFSKHEESVRIGFLAVACFLYCMAFNFPDGHRDGSVARLSFQSAQQSWSDIVLHTFPSTNIWSEYSSQGFSQTKTTTNDWFILCYSRTVAAVPLFLKNIYYSNTVRIGFKGSDIVFPFHYFW